MKRKSLSIFIGVTIFAIAMGYLESAVVIYLRQIYYPEGFAFPLKLMQAKIALTEVLREFATLVMLGSVGFIAGRSRLEKFGIFIFAFGIWDIFFYIFLRLLIDWPASLFTWDILFLIPTTWVGPVLAPVINATAMVIFGGLIWQFQSRGKLLPVKKAEWIMLILGSLIVIWAYIEDYVSFLNRSFSLSEIFFPKDAVRLIEFATSYLPQEFNWWIFGLGQMILITPIIFWTKRCSKNHDL